MVYYIYLCQGLFCCGFSLGRDKQRYRCGGRYGGGPPRVTLPAKQGLSAPNLRGGADMRVKITLACSECKQRNYDTTKNKKNDPDRLERNKYCRFCRKHTLHKETK